MGHHLFRKSLLVGMVGLWLASCAPGQISGTRFSTIQNDFIQRLRWGDYRGASQYLSEGDQEAFVKRFTSLKGLHITDVRSEAVAPPKEDGRIPTSLEIDYYLLPSPVVKVFRAKLEWDCQWERTGQNMCRISSPFPRFPDADTEKSGI